MTVSRAVSRLEPVLFDVTSGWRVLLSFPPSPPSLSFSRFAVSSPRGRKQQETRERRIVVIMRDVPVFFCRESKSRARRNWFSTLKPCARERERGKRIPLSRAALVPAQRIVVRKLQLVPLLRAHFLTVMFPRLVAGYSARYKTNFGTKSVKQ